MTCCAPCPGIELAAPAELFGYPEEWDSLLRRSYDNRIFLTATWQRTWWERFAPGEAFIATSRDPDGQLIAALPLQIERADGERVLTLLGDANVTDYMDALAEKPRAMGLLEALWSCVLTDLDWDRVDLRHVPSGSPLIPALRTAGQPVGIEVSVEADTVCPVALLCSSWDGYLEMLTKKQRHEVRRKLRRAQEGVESQWHTARTSAEVNEMLPVFFRLHEASAHDKERFMTSAMRDYFTRLATALFDAGQLRLAVLRRDGVEVASTLGFVYRDRYMLYNSGYDPEYAAYSPGIAAAALAMQAAIEEKAIAFDFLSGDEPYKYQLGASNTYTSRVTAVRAS